MKKHLMVVVAALSLASTAAYAQSATPAQGPRRHGQHGRMMKQLGLSADQQSRIDAIHARYAPTMKTAHERARPDFEALKAARARGDSAGVRAAREKLRSDMGPTRETRKQEMNEVRGILTPAQRQQLETLRAQHKGEHGKRGNHGARKDAAQRTSTGTR